MNSNRWKKLLLIIAGGSLLGACSPTAYIQPPGTKVPTRSELTQAAVKALYNVQPLSIQENKEFCGVLYLDKEDQVKATKPMMGGPDWCLMPDLEKLHEFEQITSIVGDYHTHAAYDAHSDSEVPSLRDMNGNAKLGIPGFVSTPGGRLWYISSNGQFAEQICGLGCLTADLNFQVETGEWLVRTRYSRDEMKTRQKASIGSLENGQTSHAHW